MFDRRKGRISLTSLPVDAIVWHAVQVIVLLKSRQVLVLAASVTGAIAKHALTVNQMTDDFDGPFASA
jgi:hypothetical protein